MSIIASCDRYAHIKTRIFRLCDEGAKIWALAANNARQN